MAIIDSSYRRIVGTTGDDTLVFDVGVLFGLQGHDTLLKSATTTWMVGGSDGDIYEANRLGVTFIQDAGNSAGDILIDRLGSITATDAYFFTIDSRHLVITNSAGLGSLFIMDWATSAGKIETVVSGSDVYSFNEFADLITHSPNWLGNANLEDLDYTPTEAALFRTEIVEVSQISQSLEQSAAAVDPVMVPAHADIDFNGDGKSDLLWRHDSGLAAVWLQDGFSTPSSATFANVHSSWQIADTGDFNGDGKSDIVWRQDGGAVAMWLMNGTAMAAGTTFSNVDRSWHLRDAADFNGDGRSDLLWEQDGGALALWQMNGFDVSGGAIYTLTDPNTPVSLSSGWTILRAGDFNGDHRADILLRDNNTGDAQVWLMNGSTVLAQETISSADGSWKVADVADFNGDGKDDIVWRQQTGAVAMWLMDGTAVASGTTFSSADASWTLADAADYTGDGKADLVWRQDSGAVAMWQLDGFRITAGTTFSSIDGSWHLQPANNIFG